MGSGILRIEVDDTFKVFAGVGDVTLFEDDPSALDQVADVGGFAFQ